MAEGKVLTGAGLRGQVAGKTALSTVGKSGAGLTYRGYDVHTINRRQKRGRFNLPWL